MPLINQQKAAKEFAARWSGKGYEKGESQLFWIDLLTNVFGVDNFSEFIRFEDQVHLDHTSFIDGYIPSTKVMIEQKSLDKNLRKPIKQSDGSLLSPFSQAKRYVTELPVSQHPKWIITCNFAEFLIYDMEKPQGEPEQIFLKDLEKEYYRLQFLVDTGSKVPPKELEVSIQAGELVGKLYDALKKQYVNPESDEAQRSLNMLCVRLVFCLYAEDAELFVPRDKFGQYISHFQIKDVRNAIIELFRVLNTEEKKRDPYLDDELKSFPYVNGGLFADENIEIPRFTEEIIDILLDKASTGFDWSQISPTIFGAVFESTLNPDTRRKGGMHYTSIENIHKVIDPLFLDDLRSEFSDICEIKVEKTRNEKLEMFRKKLASLTFLDPACGSGNFLTETYLSLRRLENEALRIILGDSTVLNFGGEHDIIKVKINQFYGIEINDYAVAVAKTALWIAESQMLRQTEEIAEKAIDFFPLKSYANIIEGNALRIDWESVVPKDKLNYIMGNPPFVGARIMSREQKEDVFSIFSDVKNNGNLDYVACWYKKAADFMNGTKIRTALVSTNSITQGEQVAILWKYLFEQGVHIDFAHKTFRWDNRAENNQGKKEKNDKYMAAVHCVIVGFSVAENKANKVIYDNGTVKIANNINGYLIDADNIVIESRAKPLCNIPEIGIGNQPIDDGNYLFTEEEKEEFIKIEPNSEKYFRKWLGAQEFINGFYRYCLWLGDCTPSELRSMPECIKRIENVRKFRLASTRSSTVKIADIPTRFQTENMPKTNYIILPETSSENRKYIPIGFMTPDVFCSNAVKLMPSATLYHFGILTSNVHMAWMRTVAGRLEMRYRYSKDIVYNNFPWPTPTDEQKAKIEKTAQMILDARALYPDCSLADLYDDLTMPPELRKAHQANDRAVMEAYGFRGKLNTESECVAELMKMYKELTQK
ncbi:MAG: class I SAM-dependent DNA methyltransferase [Clostridia bacterium]|nr:class I SAM-dependent DNA methyltransferase [Clostridia bacterium]